jgi:hypothetical protein
MHATFFWILFPNLEFRFKDRGAAGYVPSTTYFSKLFGRQRKEDSRLIGPSA